jgi:hypothetical protein
MSTSDILIAIEKQIDILTAARALLRSEPVTPATATAPATAPAPTAHISISGGGRITHFPVQPPVQPAPTIHEVTHPPRRSAPRRQPRPHRQLSAEARQRISEAQQKRWRKFHRQKKLEKAALVVHRAKKAEAVA